MEWQNQFLHIYTHIFNFLVDYAFIFCLHSPLRICLQSLILYLKLLTCIEEVYMFVSNPVQWSVSLCIACEIIQWTRTHFLTCHLNTHTYCLTLAIRPNSPATWASNVLCPYHCTSPPPLRMTLFPKRPSGASLSSFSTVEDLKAHKLKLPSGTKHLWFIIQRCTLLFHSMKGRERHINLNIWQYCFRKSVLLVGQAESNPGLVSAIASSICPNKPSTFKTSLPIVPVAPTTRRAKWI